MAKSLLHKYADTVEEISSTKKLLKILEDYRRTQESYMETLKLLATTPRVVIGDQASC